jgi:AraC family transcriptional regulator, exoenzyme S synthesis regulatory protein ExsA
MDNFFDFIKEFPPKKRLRVNELLLVEYHCPIDEPRFDIWSHHNYFVYVINGIKRWSRL